MDIHDPQTIQERRKVAGQCEQALQYGIRTYVDEMEDAVNKAYAAAPTRLYLVGLDGKLAYIDRLGPGGLPRRVESGHRSVPGEKQRRGLGYPLVQHDRLQRRTLFKQRQGGFQHTPLLRVVARLAQRNAPCQARIRGARRQDTVRNPLAP